MPSSTIRPSSMHDDPVGGDDRGEAVRDHERGAVHAARRRARRWICVLRLGVEVRCRLVEDHDRGVLQQHAGDGEPLLLAARQAVAALADHRVVPLGEARDQVVDAGGLARRHEVVAGRVGLGVPQVLGDRSRGTGAGPASPCRRCRAASRASGRARRARRRARGRRRRRGCAGRAVRSSSCRRPTDRRARRARRAPP